MTDVAPLCVGSGVRWRYGRKDKGIDAVPPSGRLPDADKGNPMATAKGLRDVFYRMGFNDREIVALSGAHALGRWGAVCCLTGEPSHT